MIARKNRRPYARLGLEPLEHRMMLAAAPIEHTPALLTGLAGHDDIIALPFSAPSEEGASREITVVTYGPFGTILSEEGAGWGLDDGHAYRKLENGQTAILAIDAKPLIEIFPAGADGQPDTSRLASHQLYAVEVVVYDTLTYPGQQPQAKEHRFYITRFVSAMFPGTNEIAFAHTQGPSRYNTIQVHAGSRRAPNLVSTSPEFVVKRDTQTGWGVEFVPSPSASGEVTSAIEVWAGAHARRVGQIDVSAHVVAMRTWSTNRDYLAFALAQQLEGCIPQDDPSDTDPRTVWYQMADQIIENVEGIWGPAAPPEVQADAVVQVGKIHGGSDSLLGQFVPVLPDGWNFEFADRVDAYQPNSLKSQFEISDSLRRLLASEGWERTVTVDLENLAFYVLERSNDPQYVRRRVEEELALVMAHEIGHAFGFLGHILPYVQTDQTGEWYDLMQQGEIADTWSKTGFINSTDYFKIALGMGWNAADMNDAVALMTPQTGNAVRWHDYQDSAEHSKTNPDEPLDVNDDAEITHLDAAWIVNHLLEAGGSFPVPAGEPAAPPYLDTNADGWVSPLDALCVFNHLLEKQAEGAGAGLTSDSLADGEQPAGGTTSSAAPAADTAPAAGFDALRSAPASRAAHDAVFALELWNEVENPPAEPPTGDVSPHPQSLDADGNNHSTSIDSVADILTDDPEPARRDRDDDTDGAEFSTLSARLPRLF